VNFAKEIAIYALNLPVFPASNVGKIVNVIGITIIRDKISVVAVAS
jgi:hypothetical protein